MTLSPTVRWDQSKFDAALKMKLERLKSEKVPAAVNKTAFFVALGAFKETPKKEPFEIEAEVGKEITVRNKRGRSATIPILWVLAAKRVSKNWAETKMTRGGKLKRAVAAGGFYWRTLRKKARVILNSRERSAGFFRVGFLSIIKKLGPYVRNKSGASLSANGVKIRGVLKGDATPALPGWKPTCTIVHSAQARRDKKNGLLRIVKPALDRAMATEGRQIIEYLKQETAAELNGKIN